MSKIAVFLPTSSWGDLDDSAMNKGLGGRETALVSLAMQWANQGHHVYAFVPRSDATTTHILDGGFVKWIPYERVLAIAPVLDLDLFVSWECVDPFEQLDDADVGIRVVHLQVAHIMDEDDVITDNVKFVAVLSQWAKRFFLREHPGVPEDSIVVIPNGVDLRRFEVAEKRLDRAEDERNHVFEMVYSSSPDRGLHHLLAMWPDIQDAVYKEYECNSRLHVCYGIENFVRSSRWSHSADGRRALEIERLIGEDNVIYHGKIGQDELAELLIAADLMTYPFDPMSPTETGCISICEALAAGTPVVTTDGDCIGEDYGDVTTQVKLPLIYEEYVAAVVDTLNYEDYVTQAFVGIDFAKSRSWDLIARQWVNTFIEVKEMV